MHLHGGHKACDEQPAAAGWQGVHDAPWVRCRMLRRGRGCWCSAWARLSRRQGKPQSLCRVHTPSLFMCACVAAHSLFCGLFVCFSGPYFSICQS